MAAHAFSIRSTSLAGFEGRSPSSSPVRLDHTLVWAKMTGGRLGSIISTLCWWSLLHSPAGASKGESIRSARLKAETRAALRPALAPGAWGQPTPANVGVYIKMKIRPALQGVDPRLATPIQIKPAGCRPYTLAKTQALLKLCKTGLSLEKCLENPDIISFECQKVRYFTSKWVLLTYTHKTALLAQIWAIMRS